VRRVESAGIVLGVLLAVVLPVLLHGLPGSPRELAVHLLLVAAGLALLWWRTAPQVVAPVSLGLLLAVLVLGPDVWFPDSALVVLGVACALLGFAWSGRRAVVAGVVGVAYLGVLLALSGPDSVVALPMFTVPGYVAGTILRRRQDTAEELARRTAELEREQEELEELSVRHERQRIAGELHDVVGHALSVLVIQAAAGQRLVDSEPERASRTLDVIAESARRGTADLERLVELLGGEATAAPDLGLVDDVVAHAVRSGLDVTYRVDADRAAVTDHAAHVVHRVVQEGLTNALRHAPGSPVRIRVSAEAEGGVAVSVENDPSAGVGTLRGTGRGLLGLRERVHAQGGRLRAGPTDGGGWRVEAWLPPGPGALATPPPRA
jgi:signal transduction histidine kinase